MTIVIAVLLALIVLLLMCIYGALVKALERAGLREHPSTMSRPPVPAPPPGAEVDRIGPGGRWAPPGGKAG